MFFLAKSYGIWVTVCYVTYIEVHNLITLTLTSTLFLYILSHLSKHFCLLCFSWVVVHGMAGFGKTVLAAEAVRDASLLRKVFPGTLYMKI